MTDNPNENAENLPVRYDFKPPAVSNRFVGGNGRISDEDDGEISNGPQLNAALIWQSVRRWWHLTIPVGALLAAAAVAVVWSLFEPVYEAEAWLKIEATNPVLAFAVSGNNAQRISADRFVRTQVEMLRSPVVLDRVAEQPEVASLPEVLEMEFPSRGIEEILQVGSQNDSELFFVHYESPVAQNAATVANAVVNQYIKLQEDEGITQTKSIIGLLNNETSRWKKELENNQKRVQSLSLEQVQGDLQTAGEEGGLLISSTSMDAWMRQLADSIVNREVLEATLVARQQTKTDEEAEVPGEVIEQMINESIELQELTRRLASAKLDLGETISRANDQDSSAVKAIQRQVDLYSAQIAALQTDLRSELLPTLQSRYARIRKENQAADLASLRSQIDYHTTLESHLAEKIDQYRKTRRAEGGTRDTVMQLEFARGDLARTDRIYQGLVERLDMLETESRAPSRVRVLARAKAPLAPTEWLPWRSMIAAGLGSFFLPSLLMVFWEFRVQRVVASDQIGRDVVLPLFGEVPQLPARPRIGTNRSTKLFERQLCMFEDSIHYLCRALLLSDQARDLRSLAITSAVGGEGKSSLAVQLAQSVALYSHERVILVDADLRNPSVHALLGTPLSPGVIDVVGGDTPSDEEISAAVIEDHIQLVDILPAGKLHLHPHIVLREGKFEGLLESLKRKYRYVIVDTPPVLTVGESLSVCRAADGTVVCVMQDLSRQIQVDLACNRLAAAGANLIGTVLNGVSLRRYSNKYGSDYPSVAIQREPSSQPNRT